MFFASQYALQAQKGRFGGACETVVSRVFIAAFHGLSFFLLARRFTWNGRKRSTSM